MPKAQPHSKCWERTTVPLYLPCHLSFWFSAHLRSTQPWQAQTDTSLSVVYYFVALRSKGESGARLNHRLISTVRPRNYAWSVELPLFLHCEIMRASISFSLTADGTPPPHPNSVPPPIHTQLPQIPLSGSDEEDPITRRPVTKHPLFFYRLFLIISIFFVIVIAVIFPGGYYDEGIWVAPLYGHTLSILIAIYDLYNYRQTLYLHLRDHVRHGRDSDAWSLPDWYPKRRFIVIDTLLVFYYIGVALIYLFVVSRSPYYGGHDIPSTSQLQYLL